jgi:photosystem II cytochrome b559 subunit alpha
VRPCLSAQTQFSYLVFDHYLFASLHLSIPKDFIFDEQTPFLDLRISSRRLAISRGERPFLDILQDRRYWVIHLITIPSLFLAGVIFVLSGFVYKLFGVPNFNQYFYNDNTQISLINDRFSILNEIEDA